MVIKINESNEIFEQGDFDRHTKYFDKYDLVIIVYMTHIILNLIGNVKQRKKPKIGIMIITDLKMI